MRYSLLIFFLLTTIMMLIGFDSSPVEGKISTNIPPPKQSPTITPMTEIERTFERVDVYSKLDPSKVEVDVKGRDEARGKVIIKVKDPKIAPQLAEFPDKKYTIDLSILAIPDSYILPIIASIFQRDPNAGSFPGVAVRQIGNTPIYEVVEPYTYTYKGSTITVPTGFQYDRATIPRVFWILIDKDSLSNVAPLFHDLLYRYGGVLDHNLVSPYRKFKRDEVDDLFYELMSRCGVEKWRRDAAYEAVHAFAKSHWNGQ